jgi:hypothetical protein
MNLRLSILSALNKSAGRAVAEYVLKLEVRVRMGRHPGEQEWDEEMATQAERGWIERGKDAVTDDPTVRITEAGKQAAKNHS